MKSILDIFDIQSDDAPEIIATLKKLVEEKSVSKGQVLQHQGNIKTKGFFVKKGLLRSYTIDKKGKEHIFMFAPEGWIISDVESHASKAPSVLYIDAIEDSEIEILEVESWRKLKITPEVLQTNQQKLINRVAVLQKRVIMLMSATAMERYQHFLVTYPQIVHRVPQKMIASYLGITPEALSTTKRKMLKKD